MLFPITNEVCSNKERKKAVSHYHGDNVVNTIRISASTDIPWLLEKEEN